MVQNGENLVYVKEQAGHSSIDVTVDIYGHLIPGQHRGAMDRLAGKLLEKPATQAKRKAAEIRNLPELKEEFP